MKAASLLLLVLASVLLIAACQSNGSDADGDPFLLLGEFCERNDFDCLSDFFLNPEALCDGDSTCAANIVDAQKSVPLDTACDIHVSGCRDFIWDTRGAMRPQPTPVPLDPRTIEILMADPAISEMVAGGERNVDYWLRLTPTTNPGHGDKPGEAAAVMLIFAEPVSWEGTVNTASQPCRGHGGEGHVDPDDPCLLVEREFGTEFRTYSDVREIHGAVYVRQGLVANVFGSSPYPEIIEALIEQFSLYEYE